MLVVPKTPSQEYRIEQGQPLEIRCFSPANPHYFYNGDMELNPIVQTNTVDTSSAAGDILLRDSNIVTLGLRKDKDLNKFMGLRPSEMSANGNEQLEFTQEALKIDSKDFTLGNDLTTVGSVSDFRGLKVMQDRRGSTLAVPVSSVVNDLYWSLILDTKGLKLREEDGEFRFYNKDNVMRFRFANPRIVDAYAQPIDLKRFGFDGGMKDVLRHSIEDLGGGKFRYVKQATPDLSKVLIDTPCFIDATTFYSTTADGDVYYENADWETARDAASGSTVSTSTLGWFGVLNQLSSYKFYRLFLYFSTSGMPDAHAISYVYLYLYSDMFTGYAFNFTAQLGTQASPLTTDDYDSFSGASYGYSATPSPPAWANVLNFNATGIADINKTGISKVCCRDKTWDQEEYASGPTSSYQGQARITLYDYADTTYDPYLVISSYYGAKVLGEAFGNANHKCLGKLASAINKILGY